LFQKWNNVPNLEKFIKQSKLMKNMEDLDILEHLFDAKTLELLRFFMKNPQEQYYLREIAKLSKLPVTSTYRLLNRFVSLGILKVVSIKNNKLYQIESNKTTDFLKTVLKLEPRILDAFVDKVKGFPGLSAVVLHGEEKEDRANILLIGENIDVNEMKMLCGEIREKYNFTITSLTLAKEQYEQMAAMGLYSGKKKIIFQK
jgi:DNA-binding Lrp family transcriptional regulator